MARWTYKNEQSKREGGVLGRSPRRQRHVLDHSLLGQQCRVRQSAVFQVWVSFQRNSSSTNLDTALNVRWFLFNQITGWSACSHLPANDLKGMYKQSLGENGILRQEKCNVFLFFLWNKIRLDYICEYGKRRLKRRLSKWGHKES